MGAFLAAYFCIFLLSAQDLKREFGFKSDNDAYLATGQDKYYTNGIFLSYRVAANQSRLNSGLNKKIYQLELGQKMYNAQSGYIPEIRYVDRPITAYLYLQGSTTWLYQSERALTLGVQLGTIGPAALGKQAQEFIHRLTGLYTPKGWEYQLNNEIGFNINMAYSQVIQRSNSQKMDLIWHGHANLGSTFTGMGLGFTLRSGRLNQLYQTTYNRSVISNQPKTAKITASELFFFAKPQLDLVIYDASISGGLFRANKGPVVFDAKPWVLSQELGMMFSKNRFSAQVSYTFRTPEVESGAKSHRYGSISTYYQFK